MIIPANVDVSTMNLKLKVKLKLPMKMKEEEKVQQHWEAYPLLVDLKAEEILLKECRNLEDDQNINNRVVIPRSKRTFRECVGHIHLDIYNEQGCSRTFHKCCFDHHHHHHHHHHYQLQEEEEVQQKKKMKKEIVKVLAPVAPPPDLADSFKTQIQQEEEMQQKKKKKKMKKKKKTTVKVLAPVVPPPDLAESFKRQIQELKGSEPMLVAQKTLTQTDLSVKHGRLLLPLSLIKNRQFLTPQEIHFLNPKPPVDDTKTKKKKAIKLPGIRVPLIEPSGEAEQSFLTIKRWDMKKKETGRVNPTYSLITGWNSFVTRNRLVEDMVLQVWSFRVDSELWFALVNLGQNY